MLFRSIDYEVEDRYRSNLGVTPCGNLFDCLLYTSNVAPGESFELHFEGVIADTRLGVNIPVKTDSIMLTRCV